MKRYVEGLDRRQTFLLPESLEDYVDENNPVRVIEVFVEALDLTALGFGRAVPAETGRPGYHPAVLLKLYLYGYLNRIPSSRRLEREAQRNLELVWLTGHLAPDFKTIADFRRDNGPAIRATCRQFVMLCRKLDLFSEALVAIDGSKFKAMNARDKNFTPAKLQRRIEQVEESIARYMAAMDTADRQEEGEAVPSKSVRLKEKIEKLREQMQQLQEMEVAIKAAPDQQISLTDPDARSMATSGKGTGIVGYNVQTAVDAKHHLIVAHEVTNVGHDRAQLANMARQAREAMGHTRLTVLADRGYFSGWEIHACEQAGIVPYVPKPLTSGAKFDGRFGKQDFVYLPKKDVYRCPAGEHLKWWFNRVEDGKVLRHYWTTRCRGCAIKADCTPSKQRRVKRWEHEGILDAMQKRLDLVPQAMALRRQIVEHPFGTLKAWMGATHFLTRTLKRVSTEMSLQVLAYNMKRVIAIMGIGPLMQAIRA
jgi:transposase